jgi:two-component system chemotaxis response regulator CheB
MKKSIENEIDLGPYEAVVLGVSSGGMEALSTLLPRLPEHFPLPIIVVQHLHPHSDDFLPRYLDEKCRLAVKQAEEKEPVIPGTVYIAPSNYHLLIEQDRTFSLSTAERINYARPSVDVLFETAADAYGAGLIGVILTGANNDGGHGLQCIKACGGLAIVQDPATAEADAMPRAAIAAAQVDYVLSLHEIGDLLIMLGRKQNDIT